ncbi:hypothetical protein OGAPHI_005409 [Ogataea philodendri]|uniref:Transcription factor domain-containing protein n=1 Tax=Ogataea philodendri TaxID=1378263 RepID=A0A9P8T149_9ASCO|nr:uncharacterized protein OGAPHI_005409 [Ogataea philodendri]KAH3662161.1 hypothetical protein OGAPHI_005409 [Ogataea philodendri]
MAQEAKRRKSGHGGIKFIDQTIETARLVEKGRPKLPGTSIINFEQGGSRLEANDNQSMESDIANIPMIFNQEMVGLFFSPEGYGLQDLQDPPHPIPDFVESINSSEPENYSHDRKSVTEDAQHHQISRISSHSHQSQLVAPYNAQNEIGLIMFYTQEVCQFYTMKSPNWNLYAYMGSRLACQYVPLKYSILALSALHMSIRDATPMDLAKKYYDEALGAVMQENFNGGKVSVELLLTTCFFLLLFDITRGTKHAKQILRKVWFKLQIGRFFEQNDSPASQNLSPYSYQILCYLLQMDIRSALFSGNISFPDYVTLSKEKKNPNIEYLKKSKSYDNQASDIARLTQGVSGNIYGDSYPNDFSEDDSLIDLIVVINMRNIMTLGRIVRLRNWLNQCGNSTEFDSSSFEKEIDDLVLENRKLVNLKTDRDLGPNVRFSILICYALGYCAVILYDRVCRPSIRTNDRCQSAATEIMKITIELASLRNSRYPKSQLWPFPLLIAGIETTDPIYQRWVLDRFVEYEKQGWGVHMTKAISLLKECFRRQASSDSRVDLGEVMDTTTGTFVL